VCYIKHKGSNIKVMAVLDTGSSSTVIDRGFAQHNNLPVLRGPYIKNVNYIDRSASYETIEVEVELIGQDSQFRQKVRAETVEGFSKACFLINWSEEIKKYQHLLKISVPSSPYPPLGIILIGIDNANLFEVFEKRQGELDEPIANLTPLGWAFMGRRKDYEDADEQFFNARKSAPTIFKSLDDFLDEMVAREFELEHFGLQEKESPYAKGFNGGPKDPATWSPAEKKADDKMKVKFVKNFFQVSIPWLSTYEEKLHGNFNSVRLRQDNSHTVKALEKKGITIAEVNAILQGYVEKQYIEKVPPAEHGRGWYLPFFEVVNREKSTPIRLVFDAKATYGGVSLNNQIKNTPNRLNDLVLTLMRLRRFEFAVTGDISEMFLRIRMAPEDKEYHRFYHNGEHYQWTRILFGNKSSPNASQKVLTMLGELFGTVYPNAKDTVDNSCYMDDCVDSRATETELQQLVTELPAMLLKADMRLCKFYTNSKKVATKIPRDLMAKEVKFEDKNPFFESNKVLGMVWEAETDQLTFKTKYRTFQEWKEACKITIWTKRAILKTTASTYDPLGLLSPIVMFPRTIIQQLWARELDWDQAVTEDISNKWEECLQNLLNVHLIRIPRWIYDGPNSNMELHVFCDASERAYATCIYSRVNSRGGTIATNLVCSKSRVAPLKNESVQRLELMGCVLGTRLLNATNMVYKVPEERIFYYTDSRNSLYWINTPAYKQKVYVYNRSSEIQRVTKHTQWSHVATEINPADIGTRYISTEDLKANRIWFEGPPFLRDEEYKFQHYVTSEEDLSKEGEVEMKTPTTTICFNNSTEYYTGKNEEDVNQKYPVQKLALFLESKVKNYSVGRCWNGLNKFRKFISVFIIAIMKLRKQEPRSPLVYEKTNNVIYKLSQKASFYEEIGILQREGRLKKGHILAKYNPYLDEEGIMRSNSRLEHLDYLPEETRKPIILSGTDRLTKLLVTEAHLKYEHPVSRSLLLSILHKSFIIIGITKLVKSISANCIACQKRKAQPVQQIMAPLHNRLGMPNRAFAETGLDFAGPFETIQGRGKKRKQHFVLVLTCLQTRAVHFEATDNQKTDAVVNALSRFASCRGRPKILVSDNQTSFKSANKDLKDFYQYYLANRQRIEDELNKEEDPVEWIFIPPRAPHFGGAWEIMVKAMKRALSVISKEQPMTEDDFRTFLCKAMDMINQRPLLKHYSQETEYVLTPNNFLVGRCQVGIVTPTINPPLTKLGERWRQLEALSNNLWHRFITEILPELSPRQKWKQQFNNLEAGTLVLIIDPLLPRNVWKMGIVESVELSRDGFARSATIKTGNSTYSRPITKIIPLSSGKFS
jgi:Pao retrotransposon peptidase/Family of unknown function (DUF5641)